jgi:hypothetical protein
MDTSLWVKPGEVPGQCPAIHILALLALYKAICKLIIRFCPMDHSGNEIVAVALSFLKVPKREIFDFVFFCFKRTHLVP